MVDAQMQELKSWNFGDEDIEEVLQLFNPDRLYTLAFTYSITLLHSVLSFLAFKNDIGFWKGRETMEGLSRKATVGEAICSVIVFFYLVDAGTSMIVVATEFF